MGTLQSYEVEWLNEEGDSKDKKSIVLKSKIDFDYIDSEEDGDDEEPALLVKKFIKMNKKARKFKGKKPFKQIDQKKTNDEGGEGKDVIYFQCRKRGDIKPNCPLLKKRKGKFEKFKRALKEETWSDTKCEETDEAYANICLMKNSDSDLDADAEEVVKVKYSKIHVEVTNWWVMFRLQMYSPKNLRIEEGKF